MDLWYASSTSTVANFNAVVHGRLLVSLLVYVLLDENHELRRCATCVADIRSLPQKDTVLCWRVVSGSLKSLKESTAGFFGK